MALITLRQLLDDAAERGYAIPAFNINNMEQLIAVMNAAAKVDAPVILQASRGARKYAGDQIIKALIQAAVSMYPSIPICMHQDHGNSLATCLSAIKNDFTSVMIDGSLMEDAKTIATYEYNRDITKETTRIAHLLGVSVEGELGCLGSLETGKGDKEDGHGFDGVLSREELLTNPDQAKEFVEYTQVDALAVAIGTSHGAYKFTKKPTGETLSIDTLKKINEKIPNTHLVMHGSSSVPQELQDIINQYGGDIKQTYGVPVEEIQRAIKLGVRKVNIDTDCRMAMTGQFRKVAMENKAEFDVRSFMKPAMKAMEELCVARYEEFFAAGKASKISAKTLDEMAARYKS